MIEFTVFGSAHTKGSTVSFVGRDGRVVTKTDSKGLRAWSEAVGWAAKAAGVRMVARDVPMVLQVTFCVRLPQRARAWPTVRPDIDKSLRAVLDALTGVAYVDDAQVVKLDSMKVYDGAARTVILVGEKLR